jgi:hypothetical protein
VASVFGGFTFPAAFRALLELGIADASLIVMNALEEDAMAAATCAVMTMRER